jgi:hypothetical protein
MTFVLCLLAACSVAAASGGHGHATFEGSCTFSGVLTQEPPVTNLPQPGRATARAVGTCSGSPARYFARAHGDISCGGGTATGRGFIRIGRRKLRFLFSEVRGPGVAAVRLEGARGGSAAGEARVSEEEDPVQIAQQCSGPGLRSVRIDIDIATTPSLSG